MIIKTGEVTPITAIYDSKNTDQACPICSTTLVVVICDGKEQLICENCKKKITKE